MVFLAIPGSAEQVVEEFYIDQMVRIRKERDHPSDPLPHKFPTKHEDVPDVSQAVKKVMASINSPRSRTMLRVTKPGKPRPLRQQEMNYFRPIILNHVEKYQRTQSQNPDEGYDVCFENKSDLEVYVLFDLMLVSQQAEEVTDTGSITKKNLSPIERDLGTTISVANSIVDEMVILEKNERRMLVTTESINSRVRAYTYISVGVLFAMTFLQAVYLKRYFKKKKLM